MQVVVVVEVALLPPLGLQVGSEFIVVRLQIPRHYLMAMKRFGLVVVPPVAAVI